MVQKVNRKKQRQNDCIYPIDFGSKFLLITMTIRVVYFDC